MANYPVPILPTDTIDPVPPRGPEDLSRWASDAAKEYLRRYRATAQRIDQMVSHGTAATKPAAAGLRRFFYETDTGNLFYDSGSWVKVSVFQGTAAITAVNGANQNFVVPATEGILYSAAPGAAYAFGGFAPTGGQVNGRIFSIINNTAFNMTLNHNDVGSAVGNRIACPGAANKVYPTFGVATVVWNATANCYFVLA